MTEKLYDLRPYAEEFTAEVTDVKFKDGKTAIILDRTLFFPLEGGQNSDIGVLKAEGGKAYPVMNVTIKDDVITHFIDGETEFKPGDKVSGRIDFAHRYDLMQHHSGEHIFSGITYKKYGYNNVGFHLTEDICTIDVSGPLTADELNELEIEVNRAIQKNVPIIAAYPEEYELNHLEYRSKKELKGPIRIVTIEGYDICACCAPHVRTTGEVGSFHIVRFENYKGGVRLFVKCGLRAVKEYQKDREIIEKLYQTFSTSKDDLVSVVAKLKDEAAALRGKINALKIEEIKSKAANFNNTKDSICIVEEDIDNNLLREYANALMGKTEKHVFIMVRTDDAESFRFILASAKEDVAALLNKAKETFTINGGGRNPQVMGTIKGDKDTIIKCFS